MDVGETIRGAHVGTLRRMTGPRHGHCLGQSSYGIEEGIRRRYIGTSPKIVGIGP